MLSILSLLSGELRILIETVILIIINTLLYIFQVTAELVSSGYMQILSCKGLDLATEESNYTQDENKLTEDPLMIILIASYFSLFFLGLFSSCVILFIYFRSVLKKMFNYTCSTKIEPLEKC